MLKENVQIDLIKAKANEERQEIKDTILKYNAYNSKTRKIETRERIICSGKEGTSFKRIVLILSIILIESIVIGIFYTIFIKNNSWFLFIPFGLSLIFACRVSVSNKNADSKIAWILFLLLLSPVAFAVYLLGGEFTTTPFRARKFKRINRRTKLLEKVDVSNILENRIKQECNFVQNSSDYIPYFKGSTKYFSMGEDFFEDVLIELKSAKKFIFMDFFILEEGHLSNAIFHTLIQKVNEGVDVRIIVDGLGSHGTLSLLKVNRMRKYVIKIIAFAPVIPLLNVFMNYRDHRKIIVIDGEIGYVGGTNMADEYINAKQRFGIWKDASLRVDGEAVNSITLMFLRMWEYSSNGKIDYNLYMKKIQQSKQNMESIIIPYADGPNEKQKLARDFYINIICNAKKSLYIMTPYFIVDSEIINLLKIKAKSGVDVRIIIPGIPDKKIVYELSVFNAQKLIKYGVKIYKYRPGFLHSKVVFSDDECAIVGSVNFDFRSFYHQYESAIYIAKSSSINDIKDDFLNTFNESLEITMENIKNYNIFIKISLAVIRLFSPLM